MSSIFMGIDVGVQGGIVLIDESGGCLMKYEMPIFKNDREYDIKSMVAILKTECPTYVVLERPIPMPRQGSASTFKQGRGFGIWQGILEALHVPFKAVTPQEWQKAILGPFPKGQSKEMSIAYAQKHQPIEDWRRNDKCKTPHDGFTDAYCMAVYAKLCCTKY